MLVRSFAYFINHRQCVRVGLTQSKKVKSLVSLKKYVRGNLVAEGVGDIIGNPLLERVILQIATSQLKLLLPVMF